MKKFTVFLCAMVLVFGMVRMAQAVPTYYTFQGYTEDIYTLTDPNGWIGESLADKTELTYVFEVDLDAFGTVTRNDTDVFAKADVPPYHYFYADYVGGDALPFPEDGGWFDKSWNIAEYNYGVDNSNTQDGQLWGNSMDNRLLLESMDDTYASAWEVGQVVKVVNSMYDEEGQQSVVSIYNVELVAKGGVGPAVPEPATMLLLGAGLIGLAGLGRKKFFKKA